MARMASSRTEPRSEINITPLVDIVLVLLIIFMIVTPLLQIEYEVTIPPTPPVESVIPRPKDQILLLLTSDDRIFLNRVEVTEASLAARLQEILENRADRTVFFSGDDEASFQRAVSILEIVDRAHGRVGIVLETIPVD